MAQLKTLLRLDSFSPSRISSALSRSEGPLAGPPQLQRKRATRHFSPNSIDVIESSRFAVPEQSKEALAFALLGYETFHHRPSNLPSATGATRPAILGKISYA